MGGKGIVCVYLGGAAAKAKPNYFKPLYLTNVMSTPLRKDCQGEGRRKRWRPGAFPPPSLT